MKFLNFFRQVNPIPGTLVCFWSRSDRLANYSTELDMWDRSLGPLYRSSNPFRYIYIYIFLQFLHFFSKGGFEITRINAKKCCPSLIVSFFVARFFQWFSLAFFSFSAKNFVNFLQILDFVSNLQNHTLNFFQKTRKKLSKTLENSSPLQNSTMCEG